MLTLRTKVSPRHALPLGTIVDVQVERGDEKIETRAFLRAHPIFYPRPLRDWTASGEPILVFPESPGRYTVEVEWRDGEGASGRESLSFAIEPGQEDGAAPSRVRTPAGRLWTSNAWEAKSFSQVKRGVRRELESLAGPGDVVYDLGANLGLYAALFARAVGETGHVYCVEPNPVCVYFLRSNLLGARNVDILPVAAMHHDGATTFTVNYGNTNLGLSEASALYPYKAGHEITVPCFTVDHLAERFSFRPPDVVKLDVEGVEALVVEGMTETLEAHRPVLLLELHHALCAAATLERLAPFDYRFSDPFSGEAVSPEEASRRDEVFQLVARPA